MKDILVVAGARTPMAEYNGAFRNITEIDLGAIAARGALERSGLAPSAVDHIVFGNALQTSGQAIYGARHVGLKAGLRVETPALTVNRICASGIQAIVTAGQMIRLDEAERVIAGGMENLSQAPHVIRGLRSGLRLGEGRLEDLFMVALMDEIAGLLMAGTADLLGKRAGITRQDADGYAFRSQRAAQAAFAAGKMDDEIVPVEVPVRGGTRIVREDDHRRPDATPEALAALPPVFGTELVTAGNASGIVDGAAAVAVTSARAAAELSVRPLGRVVSWAFVGVEPRLMGIGPAPAIRLALERASLRLEDIDLFEINEAFAAQYLAVERELGLDRDRVNVNGGAIAIGHPLAATGTRLVLTLLLELRRRAGRYGVASACIGGGQGGAIVVESTPRQGGAG